MSLDTVALMTVHLTQVRDIPALTGDLRPATQETGLRGRVMDFHDAEFSLASSDHSGAGTSDPFI